MNDKKFDNMLKNKLKEDTKIPNNIANLFEMKYGDNKQNIKKVGIKNKIGEIVRNIIIAASALITMVTGGCVFAHVKGIETPISSLLRKMGINSKYEQYATQINETKTSNNINIKLLNAALDDSNLIIGYEISSDCLDEDAWVDIYGNYKINNVETKPINYNMDKDENGKILIYQLFDMNEIDLKDSKNANVEIEILYINEYKEVEEEKSAYAELINEYQGNWNFNQTIEITDIKENKEKYFEENKKEVLPNIYVSIIGWVEGTYTNMLKIQTDKSDYEGDQLDSYYKILDSNNNEITLCKENREYDYEIDTQRAIIADIPTDLKLTVEVYSQKVFNGNYEKVSTINVDLSKAKEKEITEKKYLNYKDNNFEFEYNKEWENKGIATADEVGPNSQYVGALMLEIPETTNSSGNSTISIMKKAESTTIKQYVDKMIQDYKMEYLEEKDVKEFKIDGIDGYKIIFETTDGENLYYDVEYVVELNGNIYKIVYFGTNIEYNNNMDEIEKLVNSFKIV